MTRAVTILTIVLVGSLLAPPTTAAQPVKRVEYYHLDALGSVRAVTDQQGHEIERHDYLPFGEEWPQPTFKLTPLFTGKQRDAESGLDYFGARFYVPQLGRFTTVDPVTNISASLVNPQRWHRYSYALNGPQKQVDPDGRETPVRIGGHLSGLGLEAVRTSSEGGVKTLLVFAGIAVGSLSLPAIVSTGAAVGGGCLASPGCQQTALDVLEDVAGGVGGWFSGAKVGAVIGHYNAGYDKVGRELGVAVFDISADIWNRMTPGQRLKANQAFLDGIIEKRLTIQVVTNGVIKLNSTLKWEIEYLLSKGYTWSESGDVLLPPAK